MHKANNSFNQQLRTQVWQFGISVWCVAIPHTLTAQNFGYLDTIVSGLIALVLRLLPIFVTLAFVVFSWGLVVYLSRSGEEQSIEEGRNRMVWGIVALFFIVSIWGIIALLQTMVGADSNVDSTVTDFEASIVPR